MRRDLSSPGREAERFEGLDVAMRDICERLGVPPARPHDLRRTHRHLDRVLGLWSRRDEPNPKPHSEGGIASVYDRHQYADENKRIMEAVASRIMLLVGSSSGRQRPSIWQNC